jgi:hypothetical protein
MPFNLTVTDTLLFFSHYQNRLTKRKLFPKNLSTTNPQDVDISDNILFVSL